MNVSVEQLEGSLCNQQQMGGERYISEKEISLQKHQEAGEQQHALNTSFHEQIRQKRNEIGIFSAEKQPQKRHQTLQYDHVASSKKRCHFDDVELSSGNDKEMHRNLSSGAEADLSRTSGDTTHRGSSEISMSGNNTSKWNDGVEEGNSLQMPFNRTNGGISSEDQAPNKAIKRDVRNHEDRTQEPAEEDQEEDDSDKLRITRQKTETFRQTVSKFESILNEVKSSTKFFLGEIDAHLEEMSSIERDYVKCQRSQQAEDRRLRGVQPDVLGATDRFVRSLTAAGGESQAVVAAASSWMEAAGGNGCGRI